MIVRVQSAPWRGTFCTQNIEFTDLGFGYADKALAANINDNGLIAYSTSSSIDTQDGVVIADGDAFWQDCNGR